MFGGIPMTWRSDSEDSRYRNPIVGGPTVHGSYEKITARKESSKKEFLSEQKKSLQPPEHKRVFMAAHSHSSDLLLWLSLDASSEVRNALLSNTALPDQVLERLAADADRFIAAQAKVLLSCRSSLG